MVNCFVNNLSNTECEGLKLDVGVKGEKRDSAAENFKKCGKC